LVEYSMTALPAFWPTRAKFYPLAISEKNNSIFFECNRTNFIIEFI
jgi:hypothetical protein